MKKKERLLLDESRLNNKKANPNVKPFLLEMEGGLTQFEKWKRDPDIPIYLTGIIQSGDKPNRNGRIYPWEYLKRECIRYMDNEVKNGLSYGECFAEGHRILTKNDGWVDFKDLTGDEEVATMNQTTMQFEWQKITRKIAYQYTGEMVKLKSNKIDTLVTPNHKFLVYGHGNKAKVVYAHELNTNHRLPRTSNWIGNSSETIIISNEFGELTLSSSAFAEFMGWYIAEGWYISSAKNGAYSVNISQCKEDSIVEIKECLEKLGLPYTTISNSKHKSTEYTFSIVNKVLTSYLKQLGDSHNKYVPNEIKEMSSDLIELFIDSYYKGDGWGKERRTHKMTATVSKRLAYDMLELLQKTNRSGKVTSRQQYATFYVVLNKKTQEEKEILDIVYYTHKEYTDNKDLFEITSRRREYRDSEIFFVSQINKTRTNIANALKGTQQYEGMVYCVEVPNHIIYVENKGMPFWSHNCDHPADSNTPQLKNACMVIEDMWFKGKDVYGKIKVLNAYMPETAPGKMIRGFILNGKSVGISSRALGSIDETRSGQYDVIDEDLEMICWDIVSNASNFGSEKLDLSESKMMLTESQFFSGHKAKKIQEAKFETLTESEKTFLNILGVEKFLRITSGFQK